MKLNLRNYNTVLTRKLQKYQHYHQLKLNILQLKKYYPFDQRRRTVLAKLTSSPLAEVFEKQIKSIEDQGTKKAESLRTLQLEKNKEQIK